MNVKDTVTTRVAWTATLLVLLTGAAANAQSDRQSHWGLRASFAPSWDVPNRLMEIEVLQDYIGQASEITGAEFAAGIVRGRRLGGDWGLAYFRKTFSDSTRIDISNGDVCINVGAALQCGPNRDVYTTSGLAFHGVELHKFVPWFTIKRRVQLGMNLGLGAMVVSGGTVTKSSEATTFEFDQAGRQPVLRTAESTTTLDGKGFLEDLGVPTTLPVAKFELAMTGILTEKLKVRVSGGINLPGVQKFSVTGIYFFGD